MMGEARPHKYARIEYERRFLLAELPADLDPDHGFFRIIDEYILGTRLRLRRIESPQGNLHVAKLTQKCREPQQPPSQTTITNLYLNEAEFAALGDLRGRQITKRRYSYQFQEKRFSIDVFEDNLAGLIMCDAEAKNAVEINSMQFPPFVDREVTDDPAFTGGEHTRLSREEFEQFFASAFEND